MPVRDLPSDADMLRTLIGSKHVSKADRATFVDLLHEVIAKPVQRLTYKQRGAVEGRYLRVAMIEEQGR